MFFKKNDSLISKHKQAAPKAKAPKGPGQLTVFALFWIIFVAAVGTGLGLWHVQRHFEIRDFEIETARLQGNVKVRTNEIKKVDAKTAALTRYEDLLGAAKGPLGLIDPEPGNVSGLTVSMNREKLYEEAEKDAEQSLERQRKLYESRVEETKGGFFPKTN